MAQPTQASPHNAIASNMAMRRALLASAPPMRKYIGNFNSNGAPGGDHPGCGHHYPGGW